MKFDLHTHTNVSDGKLSPSELIERAKLLNVGVLSITDHDSVSAYDEIQNYSDENIRLIHGIEFSSRWRNYNIHIVGLNIDLENDKLVQAIQHHKNARIERAKRITARLSKKLQTQICFDEILGTTYQDNVGRPHIADYLIKNNYAKDAQDAFCKYLGTGKVGDIKTNWFDMEIIINIITSANGIATLAHPAKYKFTRTKLLELLDDFKTYGGEAMEIISGKQLPQLTHDLVKIAELKDLSASCGSDFHQPGHSWSELGQFENLPKSCKPVWELF